MRKGPRTFSRVAAIAELPFRTMFDVLARAVTSRTSKLRMLRAYALPAFKGSKHYENDFCGFCLGGGGYLPIRCACDLCAKQIDPRALCRGDNPNWHLLRIIRAQEL